MRFEIRDGNRRCKLDRQYLDNKRDSLHGCPVCGETDGLKVLFDMDCSVYIYCNYKIACTHCGWKNKEWHDTVADAVRDLEKESLEALNYGK